MILAAGLCVLPGDDNTSPGRPFTRVEAWLPGPRARRWETDVTIELHGSTAALLRYRGDTLDSAGAATVGKDLLSVLHELGTYTTPPTAGRACG